MALPFSLHHSAFSFSISVLLHFLLGSFFCEIFRLLVCASAVYRLPLLCLSCPELPATPSTAGLSACSVLRFFPVVLCVLLTFSLIRRLCLVLWACRTCNAVRPCSPALCGLDSATLLGRVRWAGTPIPADAEYPCKSRPDFPRETRSGSKASRKGWRCPQGSSTLGMVISEL